MKFSNPLRIIRNLLLFFFVSTTVMVVVYRCLLYTSSVYKRQVEHVSKFFGDKAVLNDVNLSVRKGEFVTILGA